MASQLFRFVLLLFMFPMLGTPLQDVLTNVPPDMLHRFQVMVEDCVALATFVAVTFDDCDPAYLRYFPKGDAPFVQSVFRRIANLPLNAVFNPGDYASIMQQRATIGLDPRFTNMVINYDNHPDALYPDCGTADKVVGYTTISKDGSQTFVIICPQTFLKYPDADEILNPPAWAWNPSGELYGGYGCDGLGDHDSELMFFPGAVLLHEILHYYLLFNNLPDYDALINLHNGERQIWDYEGPNPPSGYGAFYARVLQLLSTLNPGQYGPHEAINNADSYAVYALSIWWQWRCQRPFKESVTYNDGTNRRYPPRPSPSP
ncbi:hypothetical protein CLAIMM_14718 [Cladophialophora immunda]|nr:hypothetical protein CLAIMM_14718 [Cladophialophora immunda]